LEDSKYSLPANGKGKKKSSTKLEHFRKGVCWLWGIIIYMYTIRTRHGWVQSEWRRPPSLQFNFQQLLNIKRLLWVIDGSLEDNSFLPSPLYPRLSIMFVLSINNFDYF